MNFIADKIHFVTFPWQSTRGTAALTVTPSPPAGNGALTSDTLFTSRLSTYDSSSVARGTAAIVATPSPPAGNSALTSDTFFSLPSSRLSTYDFLLGISPTSSVRRPSSESVPIDPSLITASSQTLGSAEVNIPTLSEPDSTAHHALSSKNPLLTVCTNRHSCFISKYPQIDHMDEDDDHLAPAGDDDESSSSKFTRTHITASNPIYGFVDRAKRGNVNRR
jgi:hypothetical protein